MIKLATKAVILARGLGTRMRAEMSDASLTTEQRRLASLGIKALIPIAGSKTLLDLIVANLTAAGFGEICMVIGPEHAAICRFCEVNGLNVSFAIQNEPKGTADAVLTAENWIAADKLFLSINSDNLYPVNSLRRLREANGPAMLAFERRALIERSNIAADRIAKFAAVEIDARGHLQSVVEKPDVVAADSYVSMNAWLFSPSIFDACRAIKPSERGEYEITTAVQYAIDKLGDEFAAVRSNEGVLDLSCRADIEIVGRFLRNC